MSNSFTKTYQDGDPLLEDDLDNGFETLQPSLPNLALATTGTSGGEVLHSIGSNLAPTWITADALAALITSTGADTIGTTMTSTGANAIFADVNASSSVSVCDAIILNGEASAATALFNKITSCSVTVANIIGNAMGASGANHVLSVLSATTSTATAVIMDGLIRGAASAAGHLQVALSPAVNFFSSTSTSFIDITGLSCTLTTNGRPVRVALVDDVSQNDNNPGELGVDGTSNTLVSAYFKLLRDGTTRVTNAEVTISALGNGANDLNITLPPSSLQGMDVVAAGTYTYSVQGRVNTHTGSANPIFYVRNVKLSAYEL